MVHLIPTPLSEGARQAVKRLQTAGFTALWAGGCVRDYAGSQTDLAAHLIKAVGIPDDRFEEDHLRMMRAVRFAATLEFKLDPATADAIRRHAQQIAKVSAERIQQELTRTLLEAPETVKPGSVFPTVLRQSSADD